MAFRARIPARLFRVLLCGTTILALWACLTAKAEAADTDRIWSALVLATHSANPREPAPELQKFSGKIKKFFGYNQVELVGSATKTVTAECERWLVPSQNFWLSVKSTQAIKDGYLLDLVVFHDKRRLVSAQAKLAHGSPLMIRGPMHARGQLIIVLQVL